jgi:hypothetical protein
MWLPAFLTNLLPWRQEIPPKHCLTTYGTSVIKASGSSETLVTTYQITRHRNPRDGSIRFEHYQTPHQ